MLVLLTLFAIFLSELMSNVALVTVFVPVVIGVAEAMHVDPLYFAIPVTLGASTAFMLPMGTPPNAIVFASGKIRVAQMAKIGFVMNMISALLISVFVYFLLRLVMPPVIL
jgi:sodium-dependent dicarboxylate transporter 2/3/5